MVCFTETLKGSINLSFWKKSVVFHNQAVAGRLKSYACLKEEIKMVEQRTLTLPGNISRANLHVNGSQWNPTGDWQKESYTIKAA